MRTLVDRITRRYRQASRAEKAAGRAWYPIAHVLASHLAERSQRTLEETAAIIALLSPSVAWGRNLRHAEELIKHGRVVGYTGYGSNLKKAERVLRKEGSLASVTTPRSFKVRAFAELIESAGASQNVCVDAHAANVARGVVVGSHAAERIGARQYRLYAEAYRRAARRAGVRPSTMQAVTWLVQKRLVQNRRKTT